MLMAVSTDGSVLLARRPASGVWGGLWSLPEFKDTDSATAWATERLGAGGPVLEALPSIRHSFTHFDLDILPLRLRVERPADAVAEEGYVWYNTRAPAKLGLAAPVAALIEAHVAGQRGD